MESLLALDLSFRTGMAYFEDDVLQSVGFIENEKPHGNYDSKILIDAIDNLVSEIYIECLKVKPNKIVIEQTNRGRNRYTQKTLEWIHHEFLKRIYDKLDRVYYLDTIEWRKVLGLSLSREDRRENRRISKHNRENPKDKIRGKVKVKHVCIDYVNQKYSELNLLHKQDDEAEAILLGEAFIKIKNEIGLEKFYSDREQVMKEGRKETQRHKRRREKQNATN